MPRCPVGKTRREQSSRQQREIEEVGSFAIHSHVSMLGSGHYLPLTRRQDPSLVTGPLWPYPTSLVRAREQSRSSPPGRRYVAASKKDTCYACICMSPTAASQKLGGLTKPGPGNSAQGYEEVLEAEGVLVGGRGLWKKKKKQKQNLKLARRRAICRLDVQ